LSSYELNGLCAIFPRPYSRAPSRRYSFGLTAAPHHGNNQFFFASWQESISFRLTAIRATRRYRFFLCLTAIINFSLLQGKIFL
jgi:hypothetical protein